MYGAVPAAMPQSSAMAEYLSMARVGEIADRQSTVHTDFAAVVEAALKTNVEQLKAKSMYVCAQLVGHSIQGSGHIERAHQVKAHNSGEGTRF